MDDRGGDGLEHWPHDQSSVFLFRDKKMGVIVLMQSYQKHTPKTNKQNPSEVTTDTNNVQIQVAYPLM